MLSALGRTTSQWSVSSALQFTAIALPIAARDFAPSSSDTAQPQTDYTFSFPVGVVLTHGSRRPEFPDCSMHNVHNLHNEIQNINYFQSTIYDQKRSLKKMAAHMHIHPHGSSSTPKAGIK